MGFTLSAVISNGYYMRRLSIFAEYYCFARIRLLLLCFSTLS